MKMKMKMKMKAAEHNQVSLRILCLELFVGDHPVLITKLIFI
jgi:hypothetical protein